MKQKTESKINAIILNLENGNKKDAAAIVRGLNKVELAQMLSALFMAHPSALTWSREKRACFDNFIINSLEGLYS
jgi:hypothetical protein